VTRTGLLDAFRTAVRSELEAEAAVHAAKAGLKAAVAEQATLAADLMKLGLTSAQVAYYAAKAMGRPQDIGSRVRAAARLRQRISRLVNRGHGKPSTPPGATGLAPICSTGKEATMAIVHRKITEEWIEDPELESLDESDDEEDGDDDEDVEKRRPARR
jgi:hypothetical protein